MKKRVQDWQLFHLGGALRLWGTWPDGTTKLTSRVVYIDKAAREVHTRSGSVYLLGRVDSGYKTWYERGDEDEYLCLWEGH